MSGRDMNALAQGLYEGTDYSYLESRIIRWLISEPKLRNMGYQYLSPLADMQFLLTQRNFCQYPKRRIPGQTLAIELYIEGGVRGVEIGALMADRNPDTRENRYPDLEMVRIAIPRRVYTNNHMDYVAAAVRNVFDRRAKYREG